MKRFRPTAVILCLTLGFFFYSIYCCCFQDVVHAKEQVPSCHQSQAPKEVDHKEGCDCGKSIYNFETKPTLSKNVTQIASIDVSLATFITYAPAVTIDQLFDSSLSPQYLSIPLYLKYSNLRI